jgi:rRNA maturation endonuclease Nob1
MIMVETDPDPSRETLYVCHECGNGVESPGQASDCPQCGGRLRNTTVAHD